MNDVTLINPAKMQEAQDKYEYEYNKQMDGVLKNLRIPSGDVCFVCNQVNRTVTMLPA